AGFGAASQKTPQRLKMVPRTGLEPARLAPLPPQGSVYTNFTTWAYLLCFLLYCAVLPALLRCAPCFTALRFLHHCACVAIYCGTAGTSPATGPALSLTVGTSSTDFAGAETAGTSLFGAIGISNIPAPS